MEMQRTFSLALIGALFLLSSFATAEEEKKEKNDFKDLKELQVIGPRTWDYFVPDAFSGTKMDTPIMQTPLSIQTVPRSVMDDQQVIEVKDAVKNVSGVHASSNGFNESFIIRGFNTLNSTYRNGLRTPLVDKLETANLERVEVLKGPASILYGRIEPGGMVNLVTKQPLDGPYFSVQQQFGSYDLYRTTVDATGPLTDNRTLLYRMNIAYQNNGSYVDFVSQEKVFVAPSLTWRPASALEFNANLEYQHANWTPNGDGAYGGQNIPALGNRPAPIPISRFLGDGVFSPANPDKQDKVLVGFSGSYKFDNAWTLINRFQFMDTDTFQTAIHPMFLGSDNQTLNRLLWNGGEHRSTYGTNLDLTGKFSTGNLQHSTLIGVDYFRFQDDETGFLSVFPGGATIPSINIFNPSYGTVTNSNIQANNFFSKNVDNWAGAYFQDQITLWNNVHILGGGRYDWANFGSALSMVSSSNADATLATRKDESFSPRVGLLYQPITGISLYGNYTKSFGANNGVSATGTPFDPETATQYEGGIKAEFLEKQFLTTLAYYDITKQNVLTTDPGNPLLSVAVGEVRSRGMEFDFSGRVTNNLRLIGNYTYDDARITVDNSGNAGHRLASVPFNSGSLWVKYEFNSGALNGLGFGGGVYVRDIRQGDNANTFQLPGYHRFDAMADYRFTLDKYRFKAQLNAYNLSNATYYDYSSTRVNIVPGMPLAFIGSLRAEF